MWDTKPGRPRTFSCFQPIKASGQRVESCEETAAAAAAELTFTETEEFILCQM